MPKIYWKNVVVDGVEPVTEIELTVLRLKMLIILRKSWAFRNPSNRPCAQGTEKPYILTLIPYASSFFGTPPRDIRLFRALQRLSICCVWAPLLALLLAWRDLLEQHRVVVPIPGFMVAPHSGQSTCSGRRCCSTIHGWRSRGLWMRAPNSKTVLISGAGST